MAFEDFWNNEYPEIDTLDIKTQQMKEAGYTNINTFEISEDCWIENYYKPQESLNEKFLIEYPENEDVKMFIEETKNEAELYYKYKQHYGYVFYIGRK